MQNHSSLGAGRIVGHCKGWIAVDVWIPQASATKSTRHKNGLPNWKKPAVAERITIQDTQAFPLSTTLFHTEPDEIYRVDDSSEWIEEWWKQSGTGPDYAVESEGQSIQQVQTV